MVYPHIQYRGPAYSHQLQRNTHAITRELDSRTGDGIEVRLLWHPDDGHVSVAVNDTKTGEVFELPVGDRESAVEVFHHPFAYANRLHHGADASANSAIAACRSSSPRS